MGGFFAGDLAPLTLMTAGEMSGLDEDGNVALSGPHVRVRSYTPSTMTYLRR